MNERIKFKILLNYYMNVGQYLTVNHKGCEIAALEKSKSYVVLFAHSDCFNFATVNVDLRNKDFKITV